MHCYVSEPMEFDEGDGLVLHVWGEPTGGPGHGGIDVHIEQSGDKRHWVESNCRIASDAGGGEQAAFDEARLHWVRYRVELKGRGADGGPGVERFRARLRRVPKSRESGKE